jgi:uncharacterized cupin superfamily protein
MTDMPDPAPPLAPFALAAAGVELEPDELDSETILAGDPQVRSRELYRAPGGAWSAGVWEITPGVVTDVEADEVFVVLSGRATIAFEEGPTLDVGPGDVATLRAGDRTVWTVHETLRKVYAVSG